MTLLLCRVSAGEGYIALKFCGHLGSSAVETPAKFQSDWETKHRSHGLETLRQVVLCRQVDQWLASRAFMHAICIMWLSVACMLPYVCTVKNKNLQYDHNTDMCIMVHITTRGNVWYFSPVTWQVTGCQVDRWAKQGAANPPYLLTQATRIQTLPNV